MQRRSCFVIGGGRRPAPGLPPSSFFSRVGRTRNGELSLSLQEGGVGVDELAGLVIELVLLFLILSCAMRCSFS